MTLDEANLIAGIVGTAGASEHGADPVAVGKLTDLLNFVFPFEWAVTDQVLYDEEAKPLGVVVTVKPAP